MGQVSQAQSSDEDAHASGPAWQYHLINRELEVARPPLPPAPAVPPPPAAVKAEPVRASYMEPADLVHRVNPAYPPLARQARVQGVVVLEAVISKAGGIESLRVVTGHPIERMDHISGRPWGSAIESIQSVAMIHKTKQLSRNGASLAS